MATTGATTQLILGGFQFQDWEVPDGKIGPFGGYHALVEKKFAGGIITIDDQGIFPVEVISWSGAFVHIQDNNGNIIQTQYDRISALMAVFNQRSDQSMSFGPYNYLVACWKLEISPTNEYYQPYTIWIKPILDLSRWSNSGSGGSSSNAVTDPNNPLFSSQGATLSENNANLGNLLNTSQFLQSPVQSSLAPAVAQLSTFQQSLQEAIQQTLSGPVKLTNPLASLITQTQNSLAAAKVSNNSADASFALQASDLVSLINQNLAPPAVPIQTGNLVNPNLENVAQQYYGDSNLWTLIAAYPANLDSSGNRIMTPQLNGILNFTIPANTSAA